MDFSNVISLFCGVSLFLFGMSLMGDGLKKVAGNRLELLLYKLTNTTWKAVLLGTGVTAVIQSSSATSVMVVGFVNSGMMRLRQAVGIILGAILGTSITGWVIALSELGGGGGWLSLLSTSTLTGVMAVAGIGLRTFCKHQSKINTGDILLGFAVLMVGMSTMSGAVAPLKESPAFLRFLTAFSNPILGILAGTAFTAVLQSASAAVGIVQALTATGAIDFATAFPLIMGISIGAAVPVLLAGMSAGADGRRTSVVYLLISVAGVVLCGTAFYAVNAVHPLPFFHMTMNAVSVALVNTIFRLANVILLWPFTGLLEKAVRTLMPEKAEEKEEELVPLEDRFLAYPALAISQCASAAAAMANAAEMAVGGSLGLLESYSDEDLAALEKLEKMTDRYEDHIGTYLLKLTRAEMSRQENAAVSRYLHTLSDFERIADHALDIAYVARERSEKKMEFSQDGREELAVLEGAVAENVRIAVTAFEKEDLALARRVEPLADVVDQLCDKLKSHHVDRLQRGECSLDQGFSFNDLLTSCKEISDHCAKVARALLELDENSLNTHAYHQMVKKRSESARYMNEYAKKYALPEQGSQA